MGGFDHHDPEIEALMNRKAEDQTRGLIEADERLQRYPNFDAGRMRAIAREHDPTSILDDTDRPVLVAGGVITIDVALTHEQAAQLRQAFLDMANHITKTFEAAADAIQKICATTSDNASAFADALKNITIPTAVDRHGHASVCPRHGPTKGGLCRQCARGR